MTTLMKLQKKFSKNLLLTKQTKDLKGGNCPPPVDEGSKGNKKGQIKNHM